MTWKSFHHRGEILRTVMTTADARRDGILPMGVEGVAEAFGDELSLLGALQLRWHTRLAGRIERELAGQPMDLESAVIAAWHDTEAQLPGVRAIIDHYVDQPTDPAMRTALTKAATKEHLLLAAMAGRMSLGSSVDPAAVRVGAEIAARARATSPLASSPAGAHAAPRILERIKAALAA